MKRLITLLLIFFSISCVETDTIGTFKYEVVIESPYTQSFLIEYVNPNRGDVVFQEIILHIAPITLWEMRDSYNGEPLELTITSMDKYFPIYIESVILVNGEVVAINGGDGLYPTQVYFYNY